MGAFILVKFNGAESKHRPPPIYDRVTSETRPVEAIKFRRGTRCIAAAALCCAVHFAR
jgi:hypothetical protein